MSDTTPTPADDANENPVFVPDDASTFTPPGYDEAAVDAATDAAATPDGTHPPEDLTDRKVDETMSQEAPNA